MNNESQYLLNAAGFDTLLAALQRRGYEVVGPRVRDRAIVYDTLTSAAELPIGWHDEHAGGRYRIERATTAPHDRAFFNYVVGPHSWKKYLFPSHETLWRAQRDGAGFRSEEIAEPTPKRAFIGVRSCELHAIAIQDRVFIGGDRIDPRYAERRENIFTVAVNCSTAGANCFCVSMNTGPRVTAHYDLVLTELLDDDRHDFLIAAGSALGAEILAELPLSPATAIDREEVDVLMDATAAMMGRDMDTRDIKTLLYDNATHPRWEDVAQRCVSCGNCTAVCPTCFCSTVEDVTSLDGEHTQRERYWASCFTQDFTHIAGAINTIGSSTRVSTAARYRHWLTHKLAGWIDQFDTSGCVGCGRCITWCPPGIDLTEEVAAIRSTDGETTAEKKS